MNNPGESNYVNCKICGEILKAASLPGHLKYKHLKLRKFKCDECDKTFSSSGDLKKHDFVHTNVRPYKCNLCSNGYFTNQDLRRHFQRVHNITYTAAEIRKICGKMTTVERRLQRLSK